MEITICEFIQVFYSNYFIEKIRCVFFKSISFTKGDTIVTFMF